MSQKPELYRTTDHAIDAALRMIGGTHAPEHLPRKIHQGLQTATWKSDRQPRWLTGLAACAAASVILIAILAATHPAQRQHPAAMEVASVSQKSFAPNRSNLAPSPLRVPETSKSSLRPASVARRTRKRAAPRDAANLLSYPPTHQEKLLVQFVRTAKPEDLQALNPEYQARLEAKQEAEFAAYLKSDDDGANTSGNDNAKETAESTQTQE